MKKIKIVGALIFILSITLAVVFNLTSKKASSHNNLISVMNEQKNFTQEVSKNIFYIYKNQIESTQTLDESIKLFLNNMRTKDDIYTNDKIIKLWNSFYLHVQNFRDQVNSKSIYSTILLEKSVKDIYNTNLELILEFNKIIKLKQISFDKEQNRYKLIQYSLFTTLILLLLYMFSEIKHIISFVQKFISASKAIISNSSIKGLKPIEVDNKDGDISQAKDNFNALVKKINDSIEYSSNSIEHSYKSLDIVEQNIEDLVELIYAMNENSRDKELRKKEDAIIQSFEELSSTKKKLKNLKNDLDDLISYTAKQN